MILETCPNNNNPIDTNQMKAILREKTVWPKVISQKKLKTDRNNNQECFANKTLFVKLCLQIS